MPLINKKTHNKPPNSNAAITLSIKEAERYYKMPGSQDKTKEEKRGDENEKKRIESTLLSPTSLTER